MLINKIMLDNISFTHLNVATFTKVEIQQLILKKIGKQFQVLNLVETHMKYKTEVSIRRRFPEVEFFSNHGPSRDLCGRDCGELHEHSVVTL